MKHIIFNAFFLFFILSSAFSYYLNKRETNDQLSGFKNCEDKIYPIKLAYLSFTPNPIVAGKTFVMKSIGTNTKEINQGAIMSTSINNTNNQFDFCKQIGGKCPVGVGDFNNTFVSIIPTEPNDPKNTTFTFNTKFAGNFNMNLNINSIKL